MKSNEGFSRDRMCRLVFGVGQFGLMIALCLGPVAVMAAPTFTVNTVSDAAADSADTDYSVCRTAANNSTCTLRAAIMKANHYAGGGVTINIPANALPYTLTTLPTGADDEKSGDLNILQSMTINGAGAGSTIIDGNLTDRVLHIQANSGTVNISRVTLRNGKASQAGGGIYLDAGGLNLSNSTVTGNTGFHGGGIFTSNGTASSTFTNVTITGNTSDHLGGGISNNGSQLLTLNNCVITDNVAGSDGGGVWGNYPTTLNNCRLSGNHAAEDGGGLCSDGITNFLINNSTLNANSAVRNGGGLLTNFGTTTLNNSTLSANGAQGDGGGIYNTGSGSNTSTFFCTIAGNIADTDLTGGSGGGISNQTGTVQIWNSLLAENYTNGATGEISGSSVTSQDYNYVQSGSIGLSGTTTHNVYGGDILLDGLQGNGASATPTRALLVGSPALDQIPPALCRDSFGTAPIPDERSVARPVGANGDMGAYEGSVQPIYNRNLIRNGDAENGAGSPTGVRIGVPNWALTTGQFTAVPYNTAGGFPNTTTDPVPTQHGYNFFSGGNSANTGAFQTIDVSTIGAKIDSGNQAYTFSGDFGGFATETDAVAVAMAFLDSSHAQIGTTVSLGPYAPSDRGNVTGFKNHSLTGLLPVGTRYLYVEIEMIRSSGTADDAYLDNLSLVLSSPLLGNISTRSFVQTGDNVLIGGFVVKVGSPKKVIIRAIGPSLANFGVSNALQNPTLELHSGNTTIASNDNWGDAANHQEISNSGFAPSNSLESAILMTLNPGAYTAIVSGVSGGTGVGVIEGYDLDRSAISKFGDISTRSFVQTGDNVLIGGFIVTPNGSKNVIVRAIGPSLTQFGVPNAMQDPILELHDGNGLTFASNDNWKDTQQSQIQATHFAPSNDAESAIVQTLAPGNYTAIVRGKNNTTGVGLVEVYGLN